MNGDGQSRIGLKRRGLLAAAGVAGAFAAYVATVGAPNSPVQAQAVAEPMIKGGEPNFRRLNEAQYVRSIQQIFGSDIKVPGRFEPPHRADGLLSIGDSTVNISPSGFEQYELRAREISAQVLDEAHRGKLLNCKPASADAFDQNCAASFFATYGRLLYRRPLTQGETAAALQIAKAATDQSHNFYKGLEAGLSRLLVSPKFLFRIESSEPAAGTPSGYRLDDYALATRISFLLWDSPPDATLLDAAARGDLRTEQGRTAQVDRMMASPQFEQGVRAFFSDMFGYDQFAGLTKDQSIYPKFNAQMAKDAQEQTLRTLIDLLITNNGDYRDIFTTKKTFMNRPLGALYKLPVASEGIDGWAPYSFGANDPRAGILSMVGFLMLDPTHEGRSSPTIRGKSVREFLLCQPVPQPPPNVNFGIVQDVHNPQFRTARQRLTLHQENPACSGCHALTDPIGLSMENYDATGAFRTTENDTVIDTSGKFNGKPYSNLMQLTQLLHDDPSVPACVQQRAYEYGVGRAAAGDDEKWLDYANLAFAQDKYRFPAMIRRIATSEAFRSVAAPAPAAPKVVAAR